MVCEGCGTEVRGSFGLSALLRLTPEQQKFVIQFVMASGSLKEMSTLLDVSYPTVRARLDRLIEVLREQRPALEERRAAILDALEEKRITPQDAAGLLAELEGSTGQDHKEA